MMVSLPIVDFYALLICCALLGWIIGSVVNYLLGS